MMMQPLTAGWLVVVYRSWKPKAAAAASRRVTVSLESCMCQPRSQDVVRRHRSVPATDCQSKKTNRRPICATETIFRRSISRDMLEALRLLSRRPERSRVKGHQFLCTEHGEGSSREGLLNLQYTETTTVTIDQRDLNLTGEGGVKWAACVQTCSSWKSEPFETLLLAQKDQKNPKQKSRADDET